MTWLNTRSWGCKIGLVLGLLHFLFIGENIVYMMFHSEGRWHMFWIICGYIDFPVSLLLSKVILPAYVVLLGIQAPYHAARLLTFATFSAFHVILGTAWYLSLPILLEKLIKKIATDAAGAVVVVLLAVIPVFANCGRLCSSGCILLPHEEKLFCGCFVWRLLYSTILSTTCIIICCL